MVRKTTVREHPRKLPSGETTTVKEHSRKIPFDSEKYDPLSDKWAEAFNKKRLRNTHPDTVNTARIVFIKPVKIWAKHPEKYDVYKLDCDTLPEYSRIPKSGWPYQIVKVKGKFYVANNNGDFRRYFPPKEADKFSKYVGRLEFVEDKSSGSFRPKELDDYKIQELREIAREKRIKNYSKYGKKKLGDLIIAEYTQKQKHIRELKEEIKMLKRLEKDPGRDIQEIEGMVKARQHDLKYLQDN